MPRVLVMTDDAKREVLLDELVNPEHLGSGHSADQLIERLAWSIEDAAEVDATATSPDADQLRPAEKVR
jgi:hypothetical protein